MPPAAEPEPRAAEAPGGWSRTRQDIAIVLWPSFLVAAAGTMFFFAAVDPLALLEGSAGAELGQSRMSGYAAGFFFFWLLTAGASALSLYLARTQRPPQRGAAGPPARAP